MKIITVGGVKDPKGHKMGLRFTLDGR